MKIIVQRKVIVRGKTFTLTKDPGVSLTNLPAWIALSEIPDLIEALTAMHKEGTAALKEETNGA